MAKSKSLNDKSKVKEKKPRGHNAKYIPAFVAKQIKPGEVRNPLGRPKGSRTVFAETFLKDFLRDWEEHGSEAIETVRKEDPTNYVKIGASLLPKDFNLTHSNEAELDKILNQFDTEDIKAILAAIATASGRDEAFSPVAHKESDAGSIRSQPNSIH